LNGEIIGVNEFTVYVFNDAIRDWSIIYRFIGYVSWCLSIYFSRKVYV